MHILTVAPPLYHLVNPYTSFMNTTGYQQCKTFYLISKNAFPLALHLDFSEYCLDAIHMVMPHIYY